MSNPHGDGTIAIAQRWDGEGWAIRMYADGWIHAYGRVLPEHQEVMEASFGEALTLGMGLKPDAERTRGVLLDAVKKFKETS